MTALYFLPRYFAIFFVFGLFISCESGDNKNTILSKNNISILSDIKENSNGKAFYLDNGQIERISCVSPAGSILLSSLISGFKFTKLKTDSNFIIGNPDKLVVQNGRYYILDRKIAKGLYVFNSLGEPIYAINKIGGGPGEINTPNDFTLSDSKIYLLDQKHKVNIYDLETGKFENQFLLPVSSLNLALDVKDKSRLYLFNSTGGEGIGYDYEIITIDLKKKEVLGKDFPYLFKDRNKFPKEKFCLSNASFGISFIRILNDTIYNISEGGIKPLTYIDFGSNKIPADLRVRYSKNVNGPDELMKSTYSYGIANYFSSTKFEYFTYIHNAELVSVLKNRATQMQIEFSSFSDDKFFGAFKAIPIGINDQSGNLICFLEPNTLLNGIGNISQNTKNIAALKQYYKYSFELSKNLKADDNPILVEVEFNTNPKLK